jgi:hypothetical protein
VAQHRFPIRFVIFIVSAVECLEMMPSWFRQVKGRKLWDSLSELRSSLCERRLERTVLRPALLPVKTAQFTQFFRQVLRHTLKSLFNWECIAPLKRRSAAARLLSLCVRISPGAWMSVCCVCCVLCQLQVCASGWSRVQRSSNYCGGSLCDLDNSKIRKPWPDLGRSATGGTENI